LRVTSDVGLVAMHANHLYFDTQPSSVKHDNCPLRINHTC